MTSPCRSPRSGKRGPSRLASEPDIGWGPWHETCSVHQLRGLRKHFVIREFETFFLIVRTFSLSRIGQDRDAACRLVDLEHREDVKPIHLVDAHAQNNQIWLDSLDLRVGMF